MTDDPAVPVAPEPLPDQAPPATSFTHRMFHGWLNAVVTVSVLGGLLALIVVPALVGIALPDEESIAPQRRIEIGSGVSLLPPAGARMVTSSQPGLGEVVLRAEGLTLQLTAVEARGAATRYFRHARRKLARYGTYRPEPPTAVRTTSGVPGEEGRLAPSVEKRPGCYALFADGKAALTVVISPVEECSELPAPIRQAILSVTFGSERL